MSEKKRKIFTGEFKAKVALEAIRGIKTANEIAQIFGLHPKRMRNLPDAQELRLLELINAVVFLFSRRDGFL